MLLCQNTINKGMHFRSNDGTKWITIFYVIITMIGITLHNQELL